MTKLERIVCVEDDPDIQAVLQVALETVGGFSVRLCASGRAALDEVVRFRPDLMLLDVMMPGLDGPGTLALLRQLPEAATLPVIFLTAKVRPDEVAQYLARGAMAVIAKPFDPMTLAREIHAHWRRHHGG